MIHSDNLEVWNLVQDTPKEFLKQIPGSSGKQLTEINPTYRVKKMTEAFGPLGIGWKYQIARDLNGNLIERTEASLVNNQIVFYKVLVEVYIRYENEWVKAAEQWGSAELIEVFNSGKVADKMNDAHKSAMTDALGKLLSHFGVGSDVYLRLNDANPERPEPKTPDVRPAQRPANGVAPAKTPTNGTPKPAAAPAQPANRIFAYRAVQNWSGGQDGPKPIVTSQDWENYHNDIMHDANEAKKALWLGPQGQKQVLANLAGAVSKRHPHVSGIQYTDMGAALTAWDTMANNLARECRNHEVAGPKRPATAPESVAVVGEPE